MLILNGPSRPYLDQYIRTPNRLAFGERTVIVMSSKVAQKSYGTEKRYVKCYIPKIEVVTHKPYSLQISMSASDSYYDRQFVVVRCTAAR